VVHIHIVWVPRGLPCPYVLTVHDLLDHMYGSRTVQSAPQRLQFTSRALRKAAQLLAVSQFTRNEVQKNFSVPDDRIEVVYNAHDERFLRPRPAVRPRLDRGRYRVNYPFLLYAGAIRLTERRANDEAFSALKTELEKSSNSSI
jgi:glycosyltransferase involved in cell wall biosynthesis